MAQISRPTGDLDVGYWSNQAGQITNLYASINEPVANDADFVQSANPPTDDIFKLILSGLAVPQAGTAKIRVRARWGTVPLTTTEVAFVWASVPTANNYVLQVGTGLGQSNIYNSSVGNVLTKALSLTPGTYYSRVLAYNGVTYLSTTTPDQTVTVT